MERKSSGTGVDKHDRFHSELEKVNSKNVPDMFVDPDTVWEDSVQKGDPNVQALQVETQNEAGDYQEDLPDEETKSNTLIKPSNFVNGLKYGFNAIVNYFKRLFSFPLVREPITFFRPDDFTSTGEFDPNHRPSQADGDALEILCNYDKATKEIFDQILKEREEALASKDKYQYQTLDLSKFPPWNEAVIQRLRSTFQVFDVNSSGLIEFEELCDVLNDFGDKTPMEERRRHFDAVDVNRTGSIDFEEFITMTYALTEKPVEGDAVQLGESYKRIDRNMSRIRSLDVVQQLQAGLF